VNPELIAPYIETFVSLLCSRSNRMVWGGMTALGAIADLRAAEIWKHIDVIIQATDQGSVITHDWGCVCWRRLAARAKPMSSASFHF
jgi:hypothetical protein